MAGILVECEMRYNIIIMVSLNNIVSLPRLLGSCGRVVAVASKRQKPKIDNFLIKHDIPSVDDGVGKQKKICSIKI